MYSVVHKGNKPAKLLALLALACPLAWAQTVSGIIDRDPFDPDRGREEVVEEEEPEPEPEVVVPKGELPTLDGTLMIGKEKYAIFTTKDRGKETTHRVRLNEKIQGLRLAHIDLNHVELDGGGPPIKIEMWTGEKKNRGGTAKRASRTAPNTNRAAPQNDGVISPNTGISRDKNVAPAPSEEELERVRQRNAQRGQELTETQKRAQEIQRQNRILNEKNAREKRLRRNRANSDRGNRI